MKVSVLIFIITFLCPYIECDCKRLEAFFDKDFLEAWSDDTLGDKGKREKLLSTFIEPISSEKLIDIEGVKKKCIIEYLGEPNKYTLVEDGIEVALYYISVNWIDKEKEKFDGVFLKVIFENSKVLKYDVMIT